MTEEAPTRRPGLSGVRDTPSTTTSQDSDLVDTGQTTEGFRGGNFLSNYSTGKPIYIGTVETC